MMHPIFHVPRAGFGAPYDLADSDMQSMQAQLAAADQLYAQQILTLPISPSGSWLGDVIAQYQSVGAFGVSKVAPDIDGAGQPQATQPLTQQAWTLNASLQALPTSGQDNQRAAGNATNAQALATQMVALYQGAIASGKAALGGGPTPPVPPVPVPPVPVPPGPGPGPGPLPPKPTPAAAAGSSYTAPILLGASALGLGIVGWALVQRRRRR
jgi:hypothetical protein